MSEPVLGVVPARLESSRLPRKPLHPIRGRPLLEWVWRRIEAMEVFDRAVVATESDEVASVCESFGAPVLLTRADHPSGTDRVAEVVEHFAFRDFPVVVNVQGDEPLVREADLERVVRLVRDEGWDVGTCAAPLREADAYGDPSVVKVVRGLDGRALYFSRAPIPHQRDGEPTAKDLETERFLRHMGVYAYRRGALLDWVGTPPSPLEKIERLEQLRALENDIAIGVAVVDEASPGVDTEADARAIEPLLPDTPDAMRPIPSKPEETDVNRT